MDNDLSFSSSSLNTIASPLTFALAFPTKRIVPASEVEVLVSQVALILLELAGVTNAAVDVIRYTKLRARRHAAAVAIVVM